MSAWSDQRDITNRLIAARQERHTQRSSDIDDLLEQLAPHIVLAIANDLNDGGLITQVPIDWMDE